MQLIFSIFLNNLSQNPTIFASVSKIALDFFSLFMYYMLCVQSHASSKYSNSEDYP